jgi:hypothetical protein
MIEHINFGVSERHRINDHSSWCLKDGTFHARIRASIPMGRKAERDVRSKRLDPEARPVCEETAVPRV